MSWRDALALVARELRRRATRAALTIAAVALAAALLTALVTIARTAQNRVLSEVTTGGSLAGIKVVAAAPDPSQVDQDNATPGPPKPLDDAALGRIRSLSGVGAVYPVLSVPVLVLAPEQVTLPGAAAPTTTLPPAAGSPSPPASTSTTLGAAAGTGPAAGVGPVEAYPDDLVGLPANGTSNLPVTIVAGRLPISGNEVAVTPDFLDRLHIPAKDATAVLGVSLEVGFPRAFRPGSSRSMWLHPVIVGVAAQDAGNGQLIGTLGVAETGRDWILASGAANAISVGLQPTTYTGLFVVAKQLNKVATVRNQITAVGYSTSADEQLIASVQRYIRVVEIVLAGIGLIALVVAALGIANALFAAVRERRREIGVLKAIGASDADVLRIFLLEALAVGTVGGLIGVGIGSGVAVLVGVAVNRYLQSEGVAPLQLSISLGVLGAAVAGSALLAALSGLLPAAQAARLPAREAVEAG
ncbi:MAG: ABC transporter permease [Acidimicrobiales bacterium]